VLGGAKVKDKIQLIMKWVAIAEVASFLFAPRLYAFFLFSLLDRVDEMVIGGGMAFTFNKVCFVINHA
jgi:3-phosphoglycerate kinase